MIALSYVIPQESSCKMVTEVSGTDNKVRTSAKYDILSVDLSKSKDGQCDVWSSLGMEFFEFFILGVLTIFLTYKKVKNIVEKKDFYKREKTQIFKEIKENWRNLSFSSNNQEKSK